jgi:D-alanyl-D-alanine carboxypeptidase/D-alanyl-D-alanine-endopeptidase (penicillin-binding protein 4)
VRAIHGPEGPSSRPGRPTARKRIWATAVALLCSAGFAAPAAADLRTSLARALSSSGVSSSQTSAFVFDLNRSKVVFGRNGYLSLRPASNEKLTVAVTALDELGPALRLQTDVLGEGSLTPEGVWQGRLILKGYGDPTLGRARLALLASRVRDAGIKRVTGLILGDESYFDAKRVAPGWKASFYKEECPPLSALIVNRGRVGTRISDDPARTAARFFKLALQNAGIAVPNRSAKGVAGAGAVLIASARANPLSWLVVKMNRQSDNFYAEMLLKGLGARLRGHGTTAAGAAAVRAELVERGVTMTGVRIVDGSGLSAYDRLTGRAVTQLLISAVSDAGIKQQFVASLPVAGVNGTLADRMRSGPAYRHVFAKTGTTSRASALSGYATNASYAPRYVFSILMNGNPIAWWSARSAQDRFAQVLAGAAR